MKVSYDFLRNGVDANIENEFRRKYKRKILFKDNPPVSIDEIISRMMLGEKTYSENGKTQCGENKARSVYEIYLTCLTYFPNTNLINLTKVLKEINSKYSGYFFCPDIGKYRMGGYAPFKSSESNSNKFKTTVKDATNKFIPGGIPKEGS